MAAEASPRVNTLVSAEEAQVYSFALQGNNPTDFFQLDAVAKKSLLERVNQKYREIEDQNPAAGYKLRIVGSNAGKNPFEVQLYAYGRREVGSKMEMPEKPKCPFCASVLSNSQLKEFAEPGDSKTRVLESLQGNALAITAAHIGHILETPIELQLALLATAEKIIQTLASKGPYNYEIAAHCGTHGHQTVPHTHIHILQGTNATLAARKIVELKQPVV